MSLMRSPASAAVAVLTFVVGLLLALPGHSASAQGWRGYDRYEPGFDDAPRWGRDRGYGRRFDRRFNDYDDDAPPRRRWRDVPEDDEDYVERDDQPTLRNPNPTPNRGRVDDDFDEPDGGDEPPAAPRRNAAREAEREQPNGQALMTGGPRPNLEASAPPRVAFSGGYTPGSIIIDTSRRKLYFVTGPTSAYAYPIGVGREGFAWTGSEKVSRIADWPDWHPPAEMRKRKPELPEKMTGGLYNPLGAKAIYLGNTLYRIHGTNDPKSIGKAESSGCFRMLNQHVTHLASLVQVGTPVTVVSSLGSKVAVAAEQPARAKPPVRAPVRRWTARGFDRYDERYER